MKQYLLGIDFGTLSVRALLLDAETGAETVAEYVYPHGVMDRALPSGKALPPRYALQHPRDYLDGLRQTVGEVLSKVGAPPQAVAGICMDFTSCTVVPMTREGTPLCMLEKYENEPHAYVKLWKHHGAIPHAERITAIAKERGEAWLSSYGGTVSSEWLLPKIVEILDEAPDVYRDTAYFAEAGDWLSFLLTGKRTAGASFAGLKAFWNADYGFPSNDFFKAVDERLDGIVGDKICDTVLPTGSCVGTLTAEGAALIGLCEGIPLAAPIVDGMAPLPALSATEEKELTITVGTSSVHLVHAKEPKEIDGLCGYVKHAVVQGLYTFEAGQTGVGDMFSWFVHNCVPRAYEEAAEREGLSIHAYLRKKAAALEIGESGLIALDWFNGNRSVLKDEALSGLILGLTLNTKPEEIYRALIEATAFGTRAIVDRIEENEIVINGVCAAGGIAQKDPMMMQIYADVLNKSIRVVQTSQSAARGSAILASVAAGLFQNVSTAATHFASPESARYLPIPKNVAAYQSLYQEYIRLYNYFGNGGNDVMKKI